MATLYDLVKKTNNNSNISETVEDFLHKIISEPKYIDLSNKKRKYGEAKIMVVPLHFKDLIFSPLSQLKCIQCGFYGRTYYCGPWVPKYYVWRNSLSRMNVFLLVAGYIDMTPVMEVNLAKQPRWKASYYAGNEGTSIIKSEVNKYTSYIVNKLKPLSRKVIAFDAGGGCRRCRTCRKELGKPCRYPNETNVAPEAAGIELYTILTNLFDNFQVPPYNIFWSVRLIAANIPELTKQLTKPHNITIPERHFNVSDAYFEYNVNEIYNDEIKSYCDTCKMYSELLCNRKWYKPEDLYNRIKNMKVYVIKLNYSNKTIKGIDELYKHQLDLHRQGAWWSFQMFPHRCPVCETCTIEYHRDHEMYKKVSNRHIPFCFRYFNLDIDIVGDKYGYILV